MLLKKRKKRDLFVKIRRSNNWTLIPIRWIEIVLLLFWFTVKYFSFCYFLPSSDFQSFGMAQSSAAEREEKTSLEIMAELISSDAISHRFERTQSMGGFLANFMTILFNETLFTGFSYYSKEKCHEFINGKGTCTKELYRDDKCRRT